MSTPDPTETEPSEADAALKPCELTPAQEQQWRDTMSLMSWTAPGFQHLFYKLLSNNHGKYQAVPCKEGFPIAATDAKNILINPDGFFYMKHPDGRETGLGLPQRAFVIAHEVVHNVYGDVELLKRCADANNVPMHDGSTLPFDAKRMNMAMDYRINALLKESKIGIMPDCGCYDPDISGPNDSVLDVYRKLYEDDPDGDKGGKPGGFDVILKPGKSTGGNHARNQQQWQIEVAAAQTLEQIRSQGKMAGALKRMFQEIIEPEIPWTEYIQGFFNRRVGSGSYNWRRPDRRFIVRDLHLPSRSGHGAGWVVVWGDTSGSIGAKELEKYLGELAGVLSDVRPKRLTVIWCDAAIHHVDECEEVLDLESIKHRGVGGGGGTSCDPVFAWIDANAHEPPDAFIGFTDLYVTLPKKEPSYPVIWACVSDKVAPWGETVAIKVK